MENKIVEVVVKVLLLADNQKKKEDSDCKFIRNCFKRSPFFLYFMEHCVIVAADTAAKQSTMV